MSCRSRASCRRRCGRRIAPRSRTRWRARDPCPCPSGFVVKKGSKIREIVASSIPVPVSVTRIRTNGPISNVASGLSTSVCFRFWTLIVNVPPFSIASRALTARLTITCSSWTGSTRTQPLPASLLTTRSMSLPSIGWSIGTRSRMTCAGSSTIGSRTWRRVNASSLRVIPLARSALRITWSRSARRRVVFRKVGAGELGVAPDRRQEVVEVMRDRPRELADRLEPLGLGSLRVERVLAGDVADVEHRARRTRRRAW